MGTTGKDVSQNEITKPLKVLSVKRGQTYYIGNKTSSTRNTSYAIKLTVSPEFSMENISIETINCTNAKQKFKFQIKDELAFNPS